MEYSKKIPIKNKRFKNDDILALARAVEKEFSDEDFRRQFIIDFWDDSTIADDSIKVFNDSSFKRKRTKRIYMEYYSNGLNKHIEVTLCDSTFYNESEILLKSDDEL